MADDDILRPYKCTVHIALPSNRYAHHLKDVVSVDQEISDKVVKSFSVGRVASAPAAADAATDHGTTAEDGIVQDDDDCGGDGGGDMRVLQIKFEATDAKMLRVSMSTTYDTINVALKCFQEFGE
mmetsp:Transcript_12573/g.30695  ORF Transcript_12573/g.30695 Transcript_12573/m.30695 type:complete len:125 (-) Transcript_12573:1443-1817(-)